MTRVLYPGSFDPITYGHMNIIEQASNLFDEVVIAVMQNPLKNNGFFTLGERMQLIEKIYEDVQNIKIVLGSGAAVDVALKYNCKALIRGLRGVTDFESELQLAAINKKISNNKINTVCLFADSAYQFLSSSAVREVFNLGKDITSYVHPIVNDGMQKKLKRG